MEKINEDSQLSKWIKDSTTDFIAGDEEDIRVVSKHEDSLTTDLSPSLSQPIHDHINNISWAEEVEAESESPTSQHNSHPSTNTEKGKRKNREKRSIFSKIPDFAPHKTTQTCVQNFLANHKGSSINIPEFLEYCSSNSILTEENRYYVNNQLFINQELYVAGILEISQRAVPTGFLMGYLAGVHAASSRHASDNYKLISEEIRESNKSTRNTIMDLVNGVKTKNSELTNVHDQLETIKDQIAGLQKVVEENIRQNTIQPVLPAAPAPKPTSNIKTEKTVMTDYIEATLGPIIIKGGKIFLKKDIPNYSAWSLLAKALKPLNPNLIKKLEQISPSTLITAYTDLGHPDQESFGDYIYNHHS